MHDDEDDDNGENYLIGQCCETLSSPALAWLGKLSEVSRARQCVQTFGHCCKHQLQAEERRNVGQEAHSCTTPATHQRCPQGQSRFGGLHCFQRHGAALPAWMRSRSLAYGWANRSLARARTASWVLRRCCGLNSLCPSLRVQRAESEIPPIEQTKSGLNPNGCSDEDRR